MYQGIKAIKAWNLLNCTFSYIMTLQSVNSEALENIRLSYTSRFIANLAVI